MNITLKRQDILTYKERIQELKETNTKHPFTIFSCITYWENKIIYVESEIRKRLEWEAITENKFKLN